jgi:hypothetical protein
MREIFNNIDVEEDEIVEITELGDEYTVDIETDGNHLFFANNLLTHNSSVEEIEFDHSHISGGISKINTADNLIGIFTSRAMRERGRYQIQLMKTRSSSGVGTKIDLGFDVDTLRIFDLGEDDSTSSTATATSSAGIIANAIKRTQAPDLPSQTTAGDTPRVAAETTSAKLRNFLNNLGDE